MTDLLLHLYGREVINKFEANLPSSHYFDKIGSNLYLF